MAWDFEIPTDLLDPDEDILAYVVAQPRGTGVSRSGTGRAARPNTPASSSPLPWLLPSARNAWSCSGSRQAPRGKPKGVKGLLSSAPLSEVDSISVKRLLVGKTITVALRGGQVKLEAGAGQDAKRLATQFERAKAGT